MAFAKIDQSGRDLRGMKFENRIIRIRELSLQVSIGFYKAELLRPQRVLIDIDLHLADLSTDVPDDVSYSVNYDLVHRDVSALVRGRHFNLQETLCHDILRICLARAGVARARVWVRKPDIYADCESAGYEATALG